MDVVGEPVQHGVGEGLGGENRDPLLKRQIGTQNDRAFLVTVGYHVEEKFGSAGRQGHEAEFVQNEQIDFL
jgi:hypothetical protein